MNWLAIIIAVIANMVIGTLWYGTWAFGKSWMKLSGHNMGEGRDQPHLTRIGHGNGTGERSLT